MSAPFRRTNAPSARAPARCCSILRATLLLILMASSSICPPAQASLPVVRIRAELSHDLVSLRGVMEAAPGLELVDALGTLPLPPDDRTALRTWPGGAEDGRLLVTPLEPGRHSFEARFPDRYGASGHVPGWGLFMAGGWYPQPILDGQAALVEWDVELALPPGVVGALNDEAGEGTLRWRGVGERVGLVAIPGGELVDLEVGGVVVRLLGRGSMGGRQRRLLETMEQVWELGLPSMDLVVVEAPLLRRLCRTAPGLLYLSDRAFRLTPPLQGMHGHAVARGIIAASLPMADPWLRQMAASALAGDAIDGSGTAARLLHNLSWLPQVDDLLYTRDAPFVAELLGERFTGDPLQDDLLERFGPGVPGAVLAGRLDALGGPGTAHGVTLDVFGGRPFSDALEERGLDPALVLSWRSRPTEGGYELQVERNADGAAVTVRRRSSPEAPTEPVVVQVGAEERVWLAPPGDVVWRWHEEQVPDTVVLDPAGLLARPRMAGDRWPGRWTVVLSAFPSSWSLASGRLLAFGAARLRRQHDTRWSYDGWLYASESDLVGARVSPELALGRLLDDRRRAHRLYLHGGAAILDQAFRAREHGHLSVESGLGWTWDTRVDALFPLRGHLVRASVAGGFVPGGGEPWARGRAEGVALTALHPRVTVAGRVSGGLARGDVEHRLLSLGGLSELKSLSANGVVAEEVLVGTGELRMVPLRHISVPALLGWIEDVQWSLGVEGGVGWSARTLHGAEHPHLWAIGVTTGALVVVDVLGARPMILGLVVGAPLAVEPVGGPLPSANVYALFTQAF